MFWEALDAWGMTLADVVPGGGALRTDALAKAVPSAQRVGLAQHRHARPALAAPSPARYPSLS
jgi:hypothetical protein